MCKSRRQITKSIKIVLCIFALALIISGYTNFKFVTFTGRSRSRSAIIEMTPLDGKCQNLQMSPTHFLASYYRIRYINFLTFYLQKVGQGQRVQFLQLHLQTSFLHF